MIEKISASDTRPEILIVEDSLVEAELLRRSLSRGGYQVTIAKNGVEGLQAARARRPALILSDIRMPLMDGYELCKEIKHDTLLWNVPVILLTVLSEPEDIMEAISSGADSYTIKPFIEATLLERVRALLAMPILRRRAEERRTETVEYNGKRHTITGDSQQILNLLFSVYENSLSQNRDLMRIQAQLNLLNENLEEQILERTESLRESEEKFRSIFVEASDGIVLIDDAGLIVDCNPEFERQTGRTLNELQKKRVWELRPADQTVLAERKFHEIWAAGSGGANNLAFERPGGGIVPVEFRSALIRIGKNRYLQSISRDISERVKAAQQIKESEERYHQLFESMSSGVAIYQPDEACEIFTIKSVNRAVEHIEHLRREELLGRSVEEVFPGVRACGLLGMFQQVCRNGEAVNFPPVFYQDERIAGWRDNYIYRLASGEIISVYDDVSERIGREAQINSLNRALRVLSDCNSALIHAKNEEELLQNVCRIIVEIGGHLLAWVAYPGTDNLPAPFAHVGDEALFQLHAGLDRDPEHQQQCLTIAAQRERKTKSCSTQQESPECSLGTLHRAGVEVILALPLLSSHDTYGVLTIFSSIPAAFGDAEIRLAEELASDLAFGISTLRTRAERERMAQALHESDKRYRDTMEMARDAIINIDGERGMITAWNPAAEQIFGYSQAEAVGQNLHDLLTPARFREEARKGLAHFAATGEGAVVNKTVELLALHRNGTEFPIELSLSAMQLDGKWYATGIVRDITERKAAEAGLKLFRELVDHSHDAIEVNDPATLRLLDVNETACLTLGYSRDELLSMRIQDIDPDMDESQLKKIGEALQAHGSVTIETRHRRKDGSTYPVEVSINAVRIDRDYSVAMVRDISERKLAEEALLRLNRTLRALSAGNHALVHAESEKALLESMCRATGEAGYVLAWVGYAMQDEKKSIVPMAIFGEGGAYVEAQKIIWDDQVRGRGPTGTAVRTGQTQLVHDIQGDPRMELWREAAAKYGYASCIALPLKEDGRIIGTLTIYAAERDAFSQDQIELLEEMAGDLAYGIVTLRIRIEHEQHATILRQSLEQSIQTIASTVEARDPYTAGHQRRVGELATAIAREMGLPDEQVNGIHLAAIIHDLGKIHVPAEILSKPGKLTDIEFMLIKTHPQAGYDILKNVKFPWPIADIILQHHEKLDGSGYPQGLKGGEILLESKIITVADVVEAMTSHRPYRSALGSEAALREIERGRGSVYDPAIVDACLKLFANKEFTFSSSP